MAQNHFKPQPFKGKEDVDAWLNSFTRYADFANWDDYRKYFALKTMFKEGAAQWLQRLDHEGVVNDYDLLVAAISTPTVTNFPAAPATFGQNPGALRCVHLC